jgi:hypothetical protein
MGAHALDGVDHGSSMMPIVARSIVAALMTTVLQALREAASRAVDDLAG